jgi:hypothetical protein
MTVPESIKKSSDLFIRGEQNLYAWLFKSLVKESPKNKQTGEIVKRKAIQLFGDKENTLYNLMMKKLKEKKKKSFRF